MTSNTATNDKSHVLPLDNFSSVSLGLHIFTSIGGSTPIRLMVDTGSVGIVIAQQYLDNHCSYENTKKPFQLTYSSSGNSFKGSWVVAQVRFGELGDLQASTRRMNIRMATSGRKGRDGEFTADGLKIKMVGVGFDRDTGPGTTDSGGYLVPPDINPFILLEEMTSDGGMIPGYILSPTSITLGITKKDRDTFECVQLVRQVPTAKPGSTGLTAPDWSAPNVNVSVPTSNIPPFIASLLFDTGLSYSIVQAPKGVAPSIVAVLVRPASKEKSPSAITCRAQVADTERVELRYPGLSRSLYEYTVGEKGDVPPLYVSWRHQLELHNGVPFINTSRHGLSGFDYLFDQENGILGFRFKTKLSSYT
ncbi:hypothetical protein FRB96_001213 [Tulasnella sp. 330]|nr:hypothetical protein FRB96_001213 [Tulasnella sp. 330]KAG8883334.1 hypothetical protein FRB97_006759 [Tulasnella sp. 331]